MEHNRVNNPDLFLLALLHDLGKVLLLTNEAPEHIVGFIHPIGKYAPAIGLEIVVLQFGHDEMIYQRLKDHIPEHLAWSIRYHSALPDTIAPYLTPKERDFETSLLAQFRPYDQGSKSFHRLPRVNLAPYRELIEKTFPKIGRAHV